MKDEIQAGLKNAIERGSTIEEAVQSFTNAGYNPVEVKEAANNISQGVTDIVNQNKATVENSPSKSMSSQANQDAFRTFSSPTTQSTVQQQQIQQPQQSQTEFPQFKVPDQPSIGMSKKKKTVIILVVVLFILLAALVGLIFFSKTLLDLIA